MIYDNIEKLCAKKNISIRRVEEAAGLGNGTIGKWKNDNCQPSFTSLQKVAEALEVSVSTLIRERKD